MNPSRGEHPYVPRGGAGAGGGARAAAQQRAQRVDAPRRSACAPAAPRAVVTCARGSSDHAATFASYLIETRLGRAHLLGRAVGELGLRRRARPAPAPCCSPSRSRGQPRPAGGRRGAAQAGARIVALVNAETSPLAQAGRRHSSRCAPGPERSVAATKSYIASLAAIVQLVAEWSGDAALAGGAAASARAARARLGARLERGRDAASPRPSDLYVIGRGPGLGVAQEAALKFKETCGLHAEAISAAEVRHGPMALVRAGFPVLLFAQNDETRERHRRRSAASSRRGAQCHAGGRAGRRAHAAADASSAHPVIEPLLFAQSFYRMANALALARGRDPDRPPHLQQGDRDRLMALALVNGRVLQPTRASSRAAACSSSGAASSTSCRRRIRAAAPPSAYDLGGQLLLPGFIDSQVNGGGGVLFNDAPSVESIRAIGAAHRRFGTTGFLPTLISDDLDIVAQRHRRGARRDRGRRARACSASTSRARSSTWRARACTIRPSCASSTPSGRRPAHLAARRAHAGDAGAGDDHAGDHRQLVERRRRRVRRPHQRHLRRDARGAATTGSPASRTSSTPCRRSPAASPAWSARRSTTRDSWCGLIVDGEHIDPVVLRIALRCKPHDRFMLVTDAMPSVGTHDKLVRAAGPAHHGAAARLRRRGRPPRRLRHRHGELRAQRGAAARRAAREAVRMASELPGRSSSASAHELGRIAPGYRANLVLADDELNVKETWIDGQRRSRSPEAARYSPPPPAPGSRGAVGQHQRVARARRAVRLDRRGLVDDARIVQQQHASTAPPW